MTAYPGTGTAPWTEPPITTASSHRNVISAPRRDGGGAQRHFTQFQRADGEHLSAPRQPGQWRLVTGRG